jgi:hypothetical protein
MIEFKKKAKKKPFRWERPSVYPDACTIRSLSLSGQVSYASGRSLRYSYRVKDEHFFNTKVKTPKKFEKFKLPETKK